MSGVRYDKIGKSYNRTRQADPYLFQRLYSLLNPDHQGIYLDIGCGTGNYTTLFQQKGLTVIGIDPSKEMLNKAAELDSKVIWRKATSEDTGLPTSTIDGVIGSLTIHHWTNLDLAFKELSRIIIPGAKFVLFTSTASQMKGYWLNHYFPQMLKDSMLQMPSIETVQKYLKANNFIDIKTEKYFVKNDLKDHFLYCGKNRPELYLNPQIRHGISSFSSLANKTEIDLGLSLLKKDIQSKKILDLIKQYENNKGDYTFLTALRSQI